MISLTHSATFTTWPWLARSRSRQLALALLALLALLITFQQVVASSVRQGADRRAERAAKADATWRCKNLPGKLAGQCLAALAALTETPG